MIRLLALWTSFKKHPRTKGTMAKFFPLPLALLYILINTQFNLGSPEFHNARERETIFREFVDMLTNRKSPYKEGLHEMTVAEKQSILNEHNMLRASVSPPASNMKFLVSFLFLIISLCIIYFNSTLQTDTCTQ